MVTGLEKTAHGVVESSLPRDQPPPTSAVSRIVGHLGESSGVGGYSFGRRESGIRGVAAALHLKRHEVGYLTSIRDHSISIRNHL